MSWDDLSMREKAAMMRVAVKNKIFDIDNIKKQYNSYAEGGPTQKKYPTYNELINNPEYGLVQDTFNGKLIYRQPGDPEKAKWFYASRAEEAPNQTVNWPIATSKQADNYDAKGYSPSTGVLTDDARSRDYRGIVAPADPYSLHATEDPFHIYNQNEVALMPEGTTMVPRVLKTNVGDIFTTNCIAIAEPALGNTLAPNAQGILDTAAEDAEMVWQVVKVYTMPDYQKGVKVMRIK